jgi:glycosidase
MEHPGPPRFAAVGDEIELAPRDPDPTASYHWQIADAPEDSETTLGDEPVEHFQPDAPGRYTIHHETPADEYELTVRVFAASQRPGDSETRQHYSGTEAPGGDDPTKTADAGDDEDDDAGSGIRRLGDSAGEAERPRIQLETTVTDDEVIVESVVKPERDDAGDGAGNDVTAAGTRVEFLLDDRDGIDESAVTVEGTELHVPRSEIEERARVHAVAVTDDAYSVPDQIALDAEQGGELTVSRPYDPPEWALDSVIYEVYVRTFAGNGVEDGGDGDGGVEDGGDGDGGVEDGGDGDGGVEDGGDGDGGVEDDSSEDDDTETEPTAFARIRERLDYLDDLGIDVLWLTPVLQNDHAPHGYNITDFFAIASDLGGREEYEALIEAAHDRDIRVVFDLVLNHSAREHPFFRDAYGDGSVDLGTGSPNPDSEYYSWYDWQESGEPETYFEWEYIANFDFDTLAVRRHLLDAVDEWFSLVDGFRCDMAWAVPNSFWREIHDRVKSRDSEFLLLDETIPYIPEFQAGLFDMHFDSTTAFQLREIGEGTVPAASLLDAVTERQRIGFPDHASFMLYAENHDETRYITKCGKPAALAAAGALATLPGAPMVYAGQELGQLGRRDALDWQNAHEDLQAHYRRLLDLRHRTPALAHRAGLDGVAYTVERGAENAVVAYHRSAEVQTAQGAEGIDHDDGADHDDGTDHDDVIVVLNFAEEPAMVSLDPPVAGTDLVTGEAVETDPVSVESVVVLPAG